MSNSLIFPIYNLVHQLATQKTPEERAMEAYSWFAATARTKAEFDTWMADADNQEAFGYITLYASVLTAFQSSSIAVANLKTADAYESIMGSNSYPAGQSVIDNVSATEFVVPSGVFTVSVVCVGGGGGGGSGGSGGHGGGGGGLGWKNNIAVVPGEVVSLAVGQGGDSSAGNDSWFFGSSVNDALVTGLGGGRGTNSGPGGGGGFSGDGGGIGGSGGATAANNYVSGGGGAGGYSGNGGDGGERGGGAGANGAGGGAGGGSGGGSADTSGAGGGVGLLGEGASGSGGAASSSDGNPGFGGSGGQNATSPNFSSTAQSAPGLYGGGGAYADNYNSEVAPGAQGAIRIIWPGNERQFPSTRTADE